MPAIHIILLAFLPFVCSVLGHKEPKTPQEIEVQRSLQAAAYHVRIIFRILQVLTDIGVDE